MTTPALPTMRRYRCGASIWRAGSKARTPRRNVIRAASGVMIPGGSFRPHSLSYATARSPPRIRSGPYAKDLGDKRRHGSGKGDQGKGPHATDAGFGLYAQILLTFQANQSPCGEGHQKAKNRFFNGHQGQVLLEQEIKGKRLRTIHLSNVHPILTQYEVRSKTRAQ